MILSTSWTDRNPAFFDSWWIATVAAEASNHCSIADGWNRINPLSFTDGIFPCATHA
jgi:hypothetical protein